MRITKKFSILKTSLLVLLIAAAAVSLPSCRDGADQTEADTSIVEEMKEITITIGVTAPDGTVSEHDVLTYSDTLEGALIDSGIVKGEIGPYGLYIKTVNGITADYDTDGAYWAILKDGEYLMTGAADTPIADGERYELVYTVG